MKTSLCIFLKNKEVPDMSSRRALASLSVTPVLDVSVNGSHVKHTNLSCHYPSSGFMLLFQILPVDCSSLDSGFFWFFSGSF